MNESNALFLKGIFQGYLIGHMGGTIQQYFDIFSDSLHETVEEIEDLWDDTVEKDFEMKLKDTMTQKGGAENERK